MDEESDYQEDDMILKQSKIQNNNTKKPKVYEEVFKSKGPQLMLCNIHQKLWENKQTNLANLNQEK